MADTAKLVEQLGSMTVLELVELKNALEEEWGVTAMQPAGPQVLTSVDTEEPAEEQSEFDVILTDAGQKKIQVIKAVRVITGLGLKDSKALVDEAPKPIQEGVSQEQAATIREQIEEAGGSVEVK